MTSIHHRTPACPGVYLDYNATTPVPRAVSKGIDSALRETWGNPSSAHESGRRAKKILEAARARAARLINACPSEVFFTSGGTESNNIVLLGIVRGLAARGRHVVTSRIEHPSVLNPCVHLLENGWDVTFVRVDSRGMVAVDEVERAVRPDTVLISVMLANNETGVVQPVSAIAGLARSRRIPVHTDAAQAVGKIPVDVKGLGVDYLTIAGHKLHAPKGIGALFCRSGSPYSGIMHGAGQEGGRRPGTEPVPMAVGLGLACEFVGSDLLTEAARQRGLRERLFAGLSGLGCPVVRHGGADCTLPNTLSIAFVGVEGAGVLEKAPEVMASTGAACHDREVKMSHVLNAMGVSREVAMGTLRFSLGRETTEGEIDQAVLAVARALEEVLRGRMWRFWGTGDGT